MNNIFSLPDDTIIYPAHDYKGRMMSTVGEEKKWNPRLSKPLEEFQGIMIELHKGLALPAKLHEAVPRNMVCDLPDVPLSK
jgi:sulfur dioxygenase